MPALIAAALEFVHSTTAHEANATSLGDDVSTLASSIARNACLHLDGLRIHFINISGQ